MIPFMINFVVSMSRRVSLRFVFALVFSVSYIALVFIQLRLLSEIPGYRYYFLLIDILILISFILPYIGNFLIGRGSVS